jgi:glycosyltransferase involved in cell wall biosynthesis
VSPPPTSAASHAGAPSAPRTVLHLDTERGWRGGERQTLWLAQALDRARYRSIVVARPQQPLAARAIAAGVEVAFLRPLSEVDPFAALALRRLIRKHHVAVVHAHTAHAVSLAALGALGTNARVVVTRRVDFPLRSGRLSRWKYGRADALIAISRAVAGALVASGIPDKLIEIIPSGIDLSRQIDPASPATLATLGVPAAAPLVVQVSQLVGHKDPVTFVEAMGVARQGVPNVQALLVGSGPLQQEVSAAISRLGLQDVVHLAGYRADADSFLAAADVVTLSSREEGLGTVLLDALSLGKPVAATTGGGIPEIIESGRSGTLVPVGDARALGSAIAKLLTETARDPARRASIAKAARERAAKFSIAVTADRTAAVYDRVLGRGPGV